MDLILLHGAIASKHQFDGLLPLIANYHTAHAINFSGHGGKAIPMTGLNLDQFCEDVKQYMDEHHIEKANIFGYSMGGYVALLFASKYPNRVHKIFTLNVKFNWDPESTLKEISFLNPEKILEKVPGFANNLMLQHGMDMWKQVLQNTSQLMQGLTKNTLLTDDILPTIQQRCLIAICEKDTTSSLQETIDVFKKLPNANLLVIPNAPHAFDKIPHDRLVYELNSFFQSFEK